MTKESFNEQFPSLKEKKQAVSNYDGDLQYIKNCEQWEDPENPIVFENNDDDLFFSVKDIQEHCLDQQKVKEAINKKLKFLNNILEKKASDIDKLVNVLGVNVAIYQLTELKKELGI